VIGVFFLQNSSSKSLASPAHTQNLPQKSSISSEAHTVTMPCETKHPNLRVFMYHYVRDDDVHDTTTTRNLSVTPKRFTEELQTVRELADAGKILLPTGDVFFELLQKHCYPKKPLWIFSADDGWQDTYTALFPIAVEQRIPFFLGIITSKMGEKGFVTQEQVQEMSKNPLITIASHSVTHREHSQLTEKEERIEFCESKKQLEELTGKEVLAYIYPVGKISNLSADIAKSCGYEIAWSTDRGEKTLSGTLTKSEWELNRTRISHDTETDFFRQILSEENK
jgi:peptidoglycan/xylan/chitin deacetylase (PgdA/CDA1 family)